MVKTDNVRSRLIQYLKELHLPSIRESFEEIAHQAEQESLSYDQYLLELMVRECEDTDVSNDFYVNHIFRLKRELKHLI